MTVRMPLTGWAGLDQCGTCRAPAGRPCTDLRSPNMAWHLSNPHAGRRRTGPQETNWDELDVCPKCNARPGLACRNMSTRPLHNVNVHPRHFLSTSHAERRPVQGRAW